VRAGSCARVFRSGLQCACVCACVCLCVCVCVCTRVGRVCECASATGGGFVGTRTCVGLVGGVCVGIALAVALIALPECALLMLPRRHFTKAPRIGAVGLQIAHRQSANTISQVQDALHFRISHSCAGYLAFRVSGDRF
jgi:hypothetical protein